MTDTRLVFRKKLDGSFDSICMRCFQTVASSSTEKGLEEPDRYHSCEDETWLTRKSNQAMRKWTE